MSTLWTRRTHPDWLSCEIRSHQTFKLQEAYTEGPVLGLSRRTSGPKVCRVMTPPGLYGTPTETNILLNGKEISALLDTGSTVSTISESYYSKHLASTILLKSFDNILDIECAGGTPLPYKGYIEANIKMPGDTNTTCQHVMLFVPDSRYSQHIPALIGTNILDNLMYHLQEEHGVRYLQNAALTTPWFLPFRCLSMREKELTIKQ